MNKDELSIQSKELSVRIIELSKCLQEKKVYNISNQIARSGTSIGANIREAKSSYSRAEFAYKMQIALKESNETSYWLELLHKTNYIDTDTYKSLEKINVSIRTMLISTIKTTKSKQ